MHQFFEMNFPRADLEIEIVRAIARRAGRILNCRQRRRWGDQVLRRLGPIGGLGSGVRRHPAALRQKKNDEPSRENRKDLECLGHVSSNLPMEPTPYKIGLGVACLNIHFCVIR